MGLQRALDITRSNQDHLTAPEWGLAFQLKVALEEGRCIGAYIKRMLYGCIESMGAGIVIKNKVMTSTP